MTSSILKFFASQKMQSEIGSIEYTQDIEKLLESENIYRALQRMIIIKMTV